MSIFTQDCILKFQTSTPDDFTCEERASGWKLYRVHWDYLPISVFLNLPPRPAQTSSFIVLLCLTPDDLTWGELTKGELMGGKGLLRTVEVIDILVLAPCT